MLASLKGQSVGLPFDSSYHCILIAHRPGRAFRIFEAHGKVLSPLFKCMTRFYLTASQNNHPLLICKAIFVPAYSLLGVAL
jgi:hypothetical protein